MRTVKASAISQLISRLCIVANMKLRDDILKAIKGALKKEKSAAAKESLRFLIENAYTASHRSIPICQDTGLAAVFMDIGQEVHIVGSSLKTAVDKGVRDGYSCSISNGNSSSAAGTIDASFIDDLWVRVSVNLAYRKKTPGLIVKPASPPKKTLTTCSNKLSDQMRVTEAMIENLSEQLRLAGLVQRDFLPSELPNTDRIKWAANFLPAEWVSGDIYDVVRLDEQHIGFFF